MINEREEKNELIDLKDSSEVKEKKAVEKDDFAKSSTTEMSKAHKLNPDKTEKVYKSYKKNQYENGGNSAGRKIPFTIPVGTLLEFRLKRLLFNMGYFPKVGVIMKTSQDEAAVTITDLDVYGIYVHKDFTSKTLWADCKSGGAKVHERISWIRGIMNTVDINNALFVKGGVRTEVKQYARKYGIQVLDLRIIEKLEKDYNILSDDWTGSWNPETQHNQLVTFSRIAVPTNEIFKKIANFISSDYWVLDNYSRVKKIITAIRELSNILDVPIPSEQLVSIKWAINELVCFFLLSTLNISKELYYFSDREKSDTIIEALSAGDVSNKKRKEIFDAAFRVAYSMVQGQNPDFIPPADLPSINLGPPRYTEAFKDLINRVTNNPLQYYDLLRFLDFSLMEYDLQSKDIDHDKLKSMFTNYNDLIIGAKTLLHFISQITGLPLSYFQILKH
ncbi:hypothetical protein KHA94_24295 [Bacillus sp. FJAT-49705]|uniref:Uncharacterized protein n=1 Tax=Cytobacillus citreus TaxID=2833586 RepID=A0ABS5NZF7_9BACI|nr:hypothetical protein [Cytobacillus citreus]MBS4193217.1 hypothetical protein [Cytobacillus citreus]